MHFQSRTFPCLPFFLAKLQAIKTSHNSCIEIPRSLLVRQYSLGASSSGDPTHLQLLLV
jgi:hypothetical protein